MSGKEPDVTFFPSVGRDLLRDLNFQLGRGEPQDKANVSENAEVGPLVDSLIEIVETAGRLADDKGSRILELEAKQGELERLLNDARMQIAETLQRAETAEANALQIGEHATQMRAFASQSRRSSGCSGAAAQER